MLLLSLELEFVFLQVGHTSIFILFGLGWKFPRPACRLRELLSTQVVDHLLSVLDY